jgi:large repetitive protein
MVVTTPVASYKLSSTTDDLATYNLTNTNAVTFVSGLVGNCANFVRASSQQLQVASAMGITNGACSLMGWVNVAALPGVGQIFGIIDKGNATNHVQYSIYLRNLGGAQRVTFNRQRQNTANDELIYATSIATSTWHQIVGTYDGTNSRLYLNGTLVAGPTAYSGNGASAGINTSRVGYCGTVDAAAYMDGKIDIAAVWNVALSQAEITELYNAGTGLEYPFTSTATSSSSFFFGPGL